MTDVSAVSPMGSVPMVTLAGMTHHDAPPHACATVFHLASEEGERLDLSLAQLATVLAVLEAEAAIPHLPENWRYQMENFYGVTF
ncbi:hypothetical protein [uncultured Paracoccus sp.]|uniref:hypothetical protein n=1 Tax=uncultured Paracoccus sp. TaxID=189685 RepID=UPI00260527EC|nr:hypothetical protein [uncultured Paracoccus sp.]